MIRNPYEAENEVATIKRFGNRGFEVNVDFTRKEANKLIGKRVSIDHVYPYKSNIQSKATNFTFIGTVEGESEARLFTDVELEFEGDAN